MRTPYVGVCGVTTASEALQVRRFWPEPADRLLAIGLLLDRPGQRATRRRISQTALPAIRRAVPGSLLIIHIQGPLTDFHELLQGIPSGDLGAPAGLQLNMVWPDPAAMRAALLGWPSSRTILQVGRRALRVAADRLPERLRAYEGLITDVLLDPSGGAGLPFDTAAMEATVHELTREQFSFGLGVAGGLGGESAPEIARLLRLAPTLNFDAEGRLRTPDDEIDIVKVKEYLRAVGGHVVGDGEE